jgi:hypothetical protein
MIHVFIEAYSEVLEEAPVLTKALTSATVYSIGDIIAQRSEGAGRLDWLRIVRSLLAGFIGHGPLSHIWYNLSEDFFQNSLGWTAWWAVFPKVVLDQVSGGSDRGSLIDDGLVIPILINNCPSPRQCKSLV